MPLQDKLKGMKLPSRRNRTSPLWRGPETDGVTFSLLSRFLVCRERFRLLVCEGLTPADEFNHRIQYGNMWHVCEEALAKGPDPTNKRAPAWEVPLLAHCKALCRQYPLQQELVDHWYQVCKVQFPIYVLYWSQHPDVTNRRPLLQEQVFSVPYSLSSGRTVLLRGKWDSVDLIGKSGKRTAGEGAGIYLQENKTKGDIVPEQMKRQLTFDLQTMLYLVALEAARSRCNVMEDVWNTIKINHLSGVRYNVVRRPLSGGKGTIVRHKATGKKPEETRAHFYERLAGIIRESPDNFFYRWRVEITPSEVLKFHRECLDPILEQLCDWWAGVKYGADPWGYPTGRSNHWRHPFGVYNVLDEGGSSDLDNYLKTGSEVGLRRAETLFPELE